MKIESRPTYIIYKTLMHSYRHLLSDAVESTTPVQIVILKILLLPVETVALSQHPKKGDK